MSSRRTLAHPFATLRTVRHPAGGIAPTLCAAACAIACTAPRAETTADVLETQQVEVIGVTPLPGSGVQMRDLPSNAQVFTAAELKRLRANSLTDFLEQNPTSITINAAQGNPYQPDVNFRGFTASPLLGTPQGISVFFDGVRINEPFGDSVNWDLMPQSAISSIQLIPGSNPAFGLNTLGGALALYTKSGDSEYPERPGGSVSLSGGSFGRRTIGFETGGHDGAWDWFATGNGANEDGWAVHNPSRVRQVFGKLGWQDDRNDLDLSFTGATNRLEGTQTLPLSMSQDIREAYTYPDIIRNQAALVTLKGSSQLTDELLLSGTAYLRRYVTHGFNSNANDNFGENGDTVQATNDAESIAEVSHGLGLQVADSGKIGGLANQLSVGVSADAGRARFQRASQEAAFTPDRGTVATGPWGNDTDATLTTIYVGAFVADSLHLDPQWTLSLSGRFNHAHVQIADRTGLAPELDGSHSFDRFSPAIGLSYNPSKTLTTYLTYNEGMRAPTAIELTCADPNAPCKLPNNFLADPPLKPVLSRTIETGARGKLGTDANWSVALFRTDLRNDLQFISTQGLSSNSGFFQNVGGTRRQGGEFSGSNRYGPLTVTLRYSFLDATYRTPFVENSPANSASDATGSIQVRAGDRITALPRHTFKLRFDMDATPDWSVGATALLASSQYARGDENNQDSNGPIPGYALLNLDTRYHLDAKRVVWARIDNVFDRRYANFGILGQNVFTGPGRTFDGANPLPEQFRGWGTPRGMWVGLDYAFD